MKKLKKLINILKLMCLFIGLAVIVILTPIGAVMAYQFIQDPVNQFQIADVSIPAKANEPTMKEWVETEITKAGLDWSEADCIVENESGWNNWKYNINTNWTTDMGLWQINSCHKDTISVECRWDYKCSTRWAIQKRLRDRNWCAWSTATKCGLECN